MRVNFKGITTYLIISALCFGFSGIAKANQTLINALRQAEQGNMSAALSARSSLNGTAKDTLNWYIYYKGAPNVSFSEITSFINAHPKWPYQKAIQREAEVKLRGGPLDSSAVAFFNRHEPITAQAMSAYVSANGANAKQVLNKWWQTASLTRDEQRKIFNTYGSSLTRQSHIKRMDSLLNKRQFSNAQAMGDAIGGGYSQLASARIGLAKGKGNVNGLLNAVPSKLQMMKGCCLTVLSGGEKIN